MDRVLSGYVNAPVDGSTPMHITKRERMRLEVIVVGVWEGVGGEGMADEFD